MVCLATSAYKYRIEPEPELRNNIIHLFKLQQSINLPKLSLALYINNSDIISRTKNCPSYQHG